jgi:ribosomal protein S18 acetylase RimI-like enzyme
MLLVRGALPADVPSLFAVMGRVIEESGAYLESSAPRAEVIQRNVAAALTGFGVQVVAEYHGVILGWAEVVPYPQSSMRHAGNLAMGVSANFRGRGLGDQLIEEALRRSFACGLKIVHLEVDAKNTVAIALYRKHGFVVDGVRRLAKRCPMSGRYEDLVLMSRVR